MRRQRAAGLLVVQNRRRSSDEAESGEKVAQLLGNLGLDKNQKSCSQEGESWPEKPRFAFKLRRATFTIQAGRSCPGVHEQAQVQGPIPSCLGGGVGCPGVIGQLGSDQGTKI